MAIPKFHVSREIQIKLLGTLSLHSLSVCSLESSVLVCCGIEPDLGLGALDVKFCDDDFNL